MKCRKGRVELSMEHPFEESCTLPPHPQILNPNLLQEEEEELVP